LPYATVVDLPSAEHQARLDLDQRDTTNEYGHFRLNPGKYNALFRQLQDDFRQNEFLSSYETRGKHVQVDEGARIGVTVQMIESAAQ
jgi:hypothetical protein